MGDRWSVIVTRKEEWLPGQTEECEIQSHSKVRHLHCTKTSACCTAVLSMRPIVHPAGFSTYRSNVPFLLNFLQKPSKSVGEDGRQKYIRMWQTCVVLCFTHRGFWVRQLPNYNATIQTINKIHTYFRNSVILIKNAQSNAITVHALKAIHTKKDKIIVLYILRFFITVV